MNLVRHEAADDRRLKSRFSGHGHRPFDLLRVRQKPKPSLEDVSGCIPWCPGWAAALKEMFAAYSRAKGRSTTSSIMTPSFLTGADGCRAGHRRTTSAPLRSRCSSTKSGYEPLQSSVLTRADGNLVAAGFYGRGGRRANRSIPSAPHRPNISIVPTNFSPESEDHQLDRTYRSTQADPLRGKRRVMESRQGALNKNL